MISTLYIYYFKTHIISNNIAFSYKKYSLSLKNHMFQLLSNKEKHTNKDLNMRNQQLKNIINFHYFRHFNVFLFHWKLVVMLEITVLNISNVYKENLILFNNNFIIFICFSYNIIDLFLINVSWFINNL